MTNEFQKVRIYSAEFSGECLSSGSYYYSIEEMILNR